MTRKRQAVGFCALVMLAALALGACGDNSGTGTVPSAIASAVPTASVGQAVCDVRQRVFDVVGQVQTGAVQSKADAASRLRSLAQQLGNEAQRLEDQGLSTAAARVRDLSTATTGLADAVEGASAGAIVSAAASAATAIASVPGCPSPSPSPSA